MKRRLVVWAFNCVAVPVYLVLLIVATLADFGHEAVDSLGSRLERWAEENHS